LTDAPRRRSYGVQDRAKMRPPGPRHRPRVCGGGRTSVHAGQAGTGRWPTPASRLGRTPRVVEMVATNAARTHQDRKLASVPARAWRAPTIECRDATPHTAQERPSPGRRGSSRSTPATPGTMFLNRPLSKRCQGHRRGTSGWWRRIRRSSTAGVAGSADGRRPIFLPSSSPATGRNHGPFLQPPHIHLANPRYSSSMSP
jgi:hypothetical protein